VNLYAFQEPTSEYEQKRMKSVMRNKSILSAVMNEVSYVYMHCQMCAILILYAG
jgi:hypothetical protein